MTVAKIAKFGLASAIIAISSFSAAAQTPPVITGPSGSSSAAFWYLGGVTPGCCSDLTNWYWTEWPVYLTTNTSDPSPTIVWSTDSPTRVQINASGSSGATLVALGHSAPGAGFDIHIQVTVDGVASAQFPVYIDTAYTQSGTAPSPSSCPFTDFPNGWYATVAYGATGINGATLIPLDVRETFENYLVKYTDENWGVFAEATWTAADWTASNTFVDTILFCWGGPPADTVPNTVTWSTSGTTLIDTETQKFWFGSGTRFVGECGLVHARYEYTDHFADTNLTTPVTSQSACAQGQFVNN